jgi:hypothetical protein
MNFESSRELDRKLTEERDYLAKLLEVTNAVVGSIGLEEICNEVVTSLTDCDFASIVLYDEACGQLRWEASCHPSRQPLLPIGMTIPLASPPPAEVLRGCRLATLQRDEIPPRAKRSCSRIWRTRGARAVSGSPGFARQGNCWAGRHVD